MGLCKAGQKKNKTAIISKANIDWSTPKSTCNKLLTDLESAGIHIDEINEESLVNVLL
jgi:predicted transcriptional regulator